MSNTEEGYFGQFGGAYVAEVLHAPLLQLKKAFDQAQESSSFNTRLKNLMTTFVGRPTPLYFAERSSQQLGVRVYIKLEGYAHTGAHKINNALGQALLAQHMGKTRIIAETGAGQHGLAVSAVCAKLGITCRIYMGSKDIARQRPNVQNMELFGAEVYPVELGSRTLKDAVNEALKDWTAQFAHTHYILGSALGPDPYPRMVQYFQSVIGEETLAQLKQEKVNPDVLIACVGGGSNSLGFFSPWIKASNPSSHPQLVGVEAGGIGENTGQHATRMNNKGKTSIIHGYKSYFLTNDDGQVNPTHSISAGLDYPGIGPQLADLGTRKIVTFMNASDKEALDALQFFARHEGILFALESAHAAAGALKIAKTIKKDSVIVINMSGRGDKDLFITSPHFSPKSWKHYLQEESAKI